MIKCLQDKITYVKKKHNDILQWFIPKNEQAISERTTYYANLFYLWILGLFCTPFFLYRFSSYGMTSVTYVLAVTGVFVVFSPLIYKKTNNLALTRELYILGVYLLNLSELFYFKGIVSSGIWFGTLPVIAVLLGGIGSALIWLLIDIVTLLGFHFYYGNNVEFMHTQYPFWYNIFLESQIGVICTLTIFIVLGETSRRNAFRGLKQAHEQIHELAIRDGLTGIYNRRFIWDEMGQAERRANAESQNFSICLLDLDKFKSINDTHGHEMGDKVLKSVAELLQSQMRQGDLCARYGGEEFLCLLNNTSKQNASVFAERLRKSVAETIVDGLNISVSIGITEYQPGEEFSKTVARADTGLYDAKANGRNCVVIK